MIYLFYRDTSNNKIHHDRPDWFKEDGYEKCFKSLLDSIENNPIVKLTVIFDGNTNNHYVEKYKEKYKYDVINIKAGSDFISNTYTFEHIRHLDCIKQDDIAGVLENDYVYLPWIEDLMTLYYHNLNYQMWENTYVSLFDHLDKYAFNIPNGQNEYGLYSNLKSQIYLGKTRYWRETPSACGSFFLSKQVFDKDIDIHTSGNADNTRFGECQKRGRKVLTPMISLATHSNKYFLAPFINWSEIYKNIKLS